MRGGLAGSLALITADLQLLPGETLFETGQHGSSASSSRDGVNCCLRDDHAGSRYDDVHDHDSLQAKAGRGTKARPGD